MAVVGAIGAIGTFILGTAWEIIAEKTLEGIGKRLTGDEDTEDFIRQQIMEKTYQTRESLLTLQQQELKTAYTFLENGYVLYYADPEASRKDFAKAREFATTSFEALQDVADKIRAVKVSIIASMHEFDGNADATFRLCTNYLRKMNCMPQTREAVRLHLGVEDGVSLTPEQIEDNKLTVKKVMDINKCIAAFLAEQQPNHKQILQNWPVIEYIPGKKLHPVTQFHELQGVSRLTAHNSTVTSLVLSDEILVTGSAQDGIRVWHPETLIPLAYGRLDNESKVFSLAVFGQWIFSGLEDGTIVVWHLDVDFRLTKERILNAHESTVWSLLVEGNVLYSGSQDKCVAVWELHDLPHSNFSAHNAVPSQENLPSIPQFPTDEERDAQEYSLPSLDCSETVHLPHWIQTLKFYKAALLLARGDDKISFVDAATGAVVTEEGFGAGDALALNENFLFTSRGCKIEVFRIRHPLDGTLEKEFLLCLELHSKRIVRLSLVGHFLVSGGYDGQIRVWDIDSFKCRSTVDVGHCGVWSLVADKKTDSQFVENVYAGCKDGAVISIPFGKKATSFSSRFSRLSSSEERRRPSVSPLSAGVPLRPSNSEPDARRQYALPGSDAAFQFPTPSSSKPDIRIVARSTTLDNPLRHPNASGLQPPNHSPGQTEGLRLPRPKDPRGAPQPKTGDDALALNMLKTFLETSENGKLAVETGNSPTPITTAAASVSVEPASPTPNQDLRLPRPKDPRGAPKPTDGKEAAALNMLKTFLANPENPKAEEEKAVTPQPEVAAEKSDQKPKRKSIKQKLKWEDKTTEDKTTKKEDKKEDKSKKQEKSKKGFFK